MSEIRELKDDIIELLVNDKLYQAEETMKKLIWKLFYLKNCENCNIPIEYKRTINDCREHHMCRERFCSQHEFKSIKELY